ncbi:hypothetical protein [Chromatium okenii]|jgi:hypothetical protein|uniref:hypothetical protein n=1 Tax=Chromatium okenii TaxID=61644 RepID=UPI0026EEBAB6|nr:hypothetical protein [Chromatium okenii]MBV5310604.1 hypothetical protein [Chromatium okenii]
MKFNDKSTSATGFGTCDEFPLELDAGAIWLRQIDAARCFGITRQRISQMVADGTISTNSAGRINPSIAAKQLLKAAPGLSRSKVLVAIRRQIETALRNQAAAEDAAKIYGANLRRAEMTLGFLQNALITAGIPAATIEKALDLAEFKANQITKNPPVPPALGIAPAPRPDWADEIEAAAAEWNSLGAAA